MILDKTKGCRIRENAADLSDCSSDIQFIGITYPLLNHQVLLKYEDAPVISGQEIIQAILYLGYNGPDPLTLYANRIIENWSLPTWNNKPAHTENNSVPHYYSGSGWGAFDVTDIMNDIVSSSNYGFLMKVKVLSGGPFRVNGLPLTYMDITYGPSIRDLNFGNNGIFYKPVQFLDGIYGV